MVGNWFCVSDKVSAISLSGALIWMVRDKVGAPLSIIVRTLSNMACMIRGTPAMTKTFSMRKPGAEDTGFRMSCMSLCVGMSAMVARALVKSSLP